MQASSKKRTLLEFNLAIHGYGLVKDVSRRSQLFESTCEINGRSFGQGVDDTLRCIGEVFRKNIGSFISVFISEYKVILFFI